jgi:hypothetical protein
MVYRIIPERHLLIDILEGDINLQMLEQLFIVEISDPDFINVNRVLSDITNAVLKISVTELSDFIQILSKDKREMDFKWAIVTDSPYPTALSMLLKGSDNFKNIIEVFSSSSAAAGFLGVTLTESDFDVSFYKKIGN